MLICVHFDANWIRIWYNTISRKCWFLSIPWRFWMDPQPFCKVFQKWFNLKRLWLIDSKGVEYCQSNQTLMISIASGNTILPIDTHMWWMDVDLRSIWRSFDTNLIQHNHSKRLIPRHPIKVFEGFVTPLQGIAQVVQIEEVIPDWLQRCRILLV